MLVKLSVVSGLMSVEEVVVVWLSRIVMNQMLLVCLCADVMCLMCITIASYLLYAIHSYAANLHIHGLLFLDRFLEHRPTELPGIPSHHRPGLCFAL